MNATFVGIRHITGVSKKTGKDFTIHRASFVSDFPDRHVQMGSVGQEVHSLPIPDRYAELFTAENIGKQFELDLYFANNEERIGYASPIAKRA